MQKSPTAGRPRPIRGYIEKDRALMDGMNVDDLFPEVKGKCSSPQVVLSTRACNKQARGLATWEPIY